MKRCIGLMVVALLTQAMACGGDAASPLEADGGRNDDFGPRTPSPQPPGGGDDGVEQEEFLVQQLAATSSYVFVPNSAPGSYTVARIDGRDFDVLPLRVGAEPKEVRAVEVDEVGAIAYVLCEGDHTLAIVRADVLAQDGKSTGHVSLLRVPQEVNALTVAPDGRHAVAYIDVGQPVLDGTSVASLQTMALIRLGDEPGQDEVFQLSITRGIREVSFDEQGKRAFVVGKEGVNVIELDKITQDRFIPPLRLDLSDQVFPPDDLEVEVSRDGSFFAVRSTQLDGVAVFELDEDGALARSGKFALDAPPTDLDLLEREAPERSAIVVTMRDPGQVLWLDPQALLDEQPVEDTLIESFDTTRFNGLTQLADTMSFMLTYTTLSDTPTLDVLDVGSGEFDQYPLLNRVRSVAISRDGQTAVVIHPPRSFDRPEEELTSQERFRTLHGVTLIDLPSGYRRPVALEGEPAELVTVESVNGEQLLYIMQNSIDPAAQGVVKLNLKSFRLDFTPLAKEPTQIGLVSGKIFVNQRASEGRITFIDLETGAQRTVSGYELNARID